MAFCTQELSSQVLTATHSNGHGCMLQYALLHLFGYAVSLDDLKNFRVCTQHVPEPNAWN